MAKKETVVDTGEALLAAINAHIAAQMGAEVPLKGQKEEEEAFEWPELAEINSMKLPALTELAGNIQLDLEGQKLGPARTLVSTARSIALDEDVEDLDDEDVEALAEALDIAPSKKVEKTVASIKEYFENEGGGEEAEEEEAEEEEKPAKKKKKAAVEDEGEEGEDEEEEKPKKKKKGDDDDADDETKSEGVDREEIAGDFDDFPDDDEMRERLEAFNEAADDDDEIEVPAKDGKPLQKAYRKLVERLVDSDGNVAEWGVPYGYDDEAMCCGLRSLKSKSRAKKSADSAKSLRKSSRPTTKATSLKLRRRQRNKLVP
jgi:hypothetical protein